MEPFNALNSLKDIWENVPPNWKGPDPCGSRWDGILCSDSRVTSITLASMQLKGTLSGDLSILSELQILDLSYNKELTGTIPPAIGNLKNLTNLILVGCGFSGPIPDTIGSLPLLTYLSVCACSSISKTLHWYYLQISELESVHRTNPPSIGNLTKLYWLDLAANQLSGNIPVSTGTTPGLDLLVHTKHFHLGLNQLSGPIPPQLFSSDMKLIHVLFESNKLTGPIPSTLGLVKTLEVVRLDDNMLTGSVPSSLSNLSIVSEMFLSNNHLNGTLPDLTGLNLLTYLDMSNNSFDETDFPPWFSTLPSLTSLVMEKTQLQGQIPTDFFALSNLQTVNARNNRLNGSLDIGTSYGNQLALVDLRENQISDYKNRPGGENVDVILVNNPVCQETGASGNYCTVPESNSSYATPPSNCQSASCFANQISSPNCKCAFPYTGVIELRAPSFSDLNNNNTYYSVLETSLMDSLKLHQLPVDSIQLSDPRKDSSQYLDLTLQVFPFGQDRFNRTGIVNIGFVLSNQTFKPPPQFGPFVFHGQAYLYFSGSLITDTELRKNLSYCFSFLIITSLSVSLPPPPPEEVVGSKKSSSTGVIIGAVVGSSVLLLLLLGAGLYAHRQKKRAQKANEQNNPFAHWESNKSVGGVPQLKGARCFTFEELRKYTNNFSETNDIGSGGYGKVYRGVLPTGELIAIKRAQQGSMQGGLEFKTEIELLSRVHHKNVVSLLGFCFERGEQMLIYEFVPNGSLMESLSGKTGIRLDWVRRLKVALGAARERGKYIVREVKMALDRAKDLYNLRELLDPSIGLDTTLKGLDKFVDVALKCVQENGIDRPKMGEVVKEIENILHLAGLNPNADSASTSASYDDVSKGTAKHPYVFSKDAFDYSGGFPVSKLEPQ
ncbi:unnamed protein product [Dovyalis caffra]|uniref:Protein kinase domain-containing protein n=1 Tax=Dovyalis caffra TaxID=77055 RepID=A0AAV1SX82_9ROSI|nr:unnamed protein product [Dovyalis caffra]